MQKFIISSITTFLSVFLLFNLAQAQVLCENSTPDEVRFKNPIAPKIGNKADFYVSPNGNDNNPGIENAPFATLDRARLAVRELKKTRQGDITVALKSGKYILRNTVVFSAF